MKIMTNSKQNNDKFAWAGYIDKAGIAISVLSLFVIIFVFSFSKNEDVTIKLSQDYEYSGVWSIQGEFIEVANSLKVRAKEGEPILIEGFVPDNVKNDWGAMLKSIYSSVNVYVDGSLIYSYGDTKPLSFGNMLGNIRLIVPITQEMAGKRFVAIMVPSTSFSIDISKPVFAQEDCLKLYVIKDNLFIGVVLVTLFVVFIICLFLAIYHMKDEIDDDSKMISHFMCFDGMVFLWLLCSSDIPQFFTNCSEGISLISFLALSIMCIPFLIFVRYLLPEGMQILIIISRIGWLLPLINLICFVFNICDPVDLLMLTHIYMAISIVSVFFLLIKCRRNLRIESKFLFAGLIILILSAIIGLVLFYFAPSTNICNKAFAAGFMLFFVIMVSVIIKRQLEIAAESNFMKTYKSVAYTDVLTGLENRSSLESRFITMTEEMMKGVLVTIVIFDIDSLKKVNNEIGHNAGDNLIIDLAQTVKDVFGNLGTYYRIGSDEIAAVLLDKAGQEKGLLIDFEKNLEIYNEHHEIKLSSSYGYSSKVWSDKPDFFKELYMEADASLREMKRIKNNRAEE